MKKEPVWIAWGFIVMMLLIILSTVLITRHHTKEQQFTNGAAMKMYQIGWHDGLNNAWEAERRVKQFFNINGRLPSFEEVDSLVQVQFKKDSIEMMQIFE